ncbi:MAG: hypothetical protein PHR77_11340 [Kiritimatiellae bacterium]|nr:hypothetical protein [Kiritimatiellia bacterium]MDD5522803.1 hypothetical protein [Kiritimatiellia bacterium]
MKHRRIASSGIARSLKASRNKYTKEESRLHGLCRNCCRAETCRYPGDRSKPVLDCEEFDMGKMKIKHMRQTARKATTRGKDIGGLCSNCAVRSVCDLPKMEGGVWHCEEYR